MTAAIFVSPRVDRTLGSVSYLVGGPEQRAWRAGVYKIQRHKDSEAEREEVCRQVLAGVHGHRQRVLRARGAAAPAGEQVAVVLNGLDQHAAECEIRAAAIRRGVQLHI